MTTPDDETADPGVDATVLAAIDGFDTLVSAAAGMKAKCVERGLTVQTGESTARAFLVAAVQRAIAPARPTLLDLFANRRR
jgi:hypothetical protein